MHIHPALTAFPFALLTLVVALELHSLVYPHRRAPAVILVNLAAAVLFTVCAFFSGYYAADEASASFQVAESYITNHHVAGRLLLILIGPCLGLFIICERRPLHPQIFRMTYLTFLAVCYGLVLYTGYLGGELVFSHGAGVNVPAL